MNSNRFIQCSLFSATFSKHLQFLTALRLLMLSSSKEVVSKMFLGKLIVKQQPGKVKNLVTLSLHADVSQFLLFKKNKCLHSTVRLVNLGSMECPHYSFFKIISNERYSLFSSRGLWDRVDIVIDFLVQFAMNYDSVKGCELRRLMIILFSLGHDLVTSTHPPPPPPIPTPALFSQNDEE